MCLNKYFNFHNTHTLTYTHAHTHIHIHIPSHTHIYTHTLTHTYTLTHTGIRQLDNPGRRHRTSVPYQRCRCSKYRMTVRV